VSDATNDPADIPVDASAGPSSGTSPAEALLRRAQALGVTLRRARESDAEAFASKMNDESVYAGTLQLPYADASFWRERLKDSGHSNSVITHLVADHAGRAVASAGLFPLAQNVRRRHAMGLGITVAKDWQGKGLGDLLMTAIVHHADRWLDLRRIELTVFTDNARAIALYRRHGFAIEGTHRGYALRDGEYADVHSMARLNPRIAATLERQARTTTTKKPIARPHRRR
jgi:putative acetyltransferase